MDGAFSNQEAIDILKGPELRAPISGIKKRGFLEGGFCKMYASLGRAAVSAKCTAGPKILGFFLVSLGVALDSAETPFVTTPFSWFLTITLNAALGVGVEIGHE